MGRTIGRRALLAGGGLALLAGCGRSEGFVVPDIELPPLPGLTGANGWAVPGIAANEFRRGVSLLNVWGSWCPSCVSEHVLLMRLLRERRVRMVGLACRDRPAKAAAFLRQAGNPFDAVAADDGRVSRALRETAVPITYVIDRTGRIVLKIRGELGDDSIAARLLPAIEAARRESGPVTG